MEEAHQHSVPGLSSQPGEEEGGQQRSGTRLVCNGPGRVCTWVSHTANVSALTSPQQPLSQRQGRP